MALLDMLAQYNSDAFLDTDPGWRQFVSDHKAYLKSIAQVRQPSQDLMGQVSGDMTRYLRQLGIPRPIAWLVGYINDLDSDVLFNESQLIYVPTISQIDLLYQSYITTRQVRK